LEKAEILLLKVMMALLRKRLWRLMAWA